MVPGYTMPNLQGISNIPYPGPIQLKSSYWHLFL